MYVFKGYFPDHSELGAEEGVETEEGLGGVRELWEEPYFCLCTLNFGMNQKKLQASVRK